MRTFIPEAEISSALQNKILSYLMSRKEQKNVTSADGTNLYTLYYKADSPRGTVIWLHGRAENAERYREAIYYCLQDGLSVLTYEIGRAHV